MTIIDRGSIKELQDFLQAHPEIEMIETLQVDVNGMLRGKRIAGNEFELLYESGLSACASIPFLDSRGELPLSIGMGSTDGDPDVMSYPITNTLAVIPWLESPVAQVFTSMMDFDGNPYFSDPRHALHNTCKKLAELGLHATVATEFEFYLLEAGDGSVPRPKMGKISGTNLKQEGTQYATMQDLWEFDPLLMDMQRTCQLQNIPANTALSEFAPGQFEINLHHISDPVSACDHGLILKRIIKGTAFKHGLGATFMAKPFSEHAGNGLHVHVSLYDDEGNNVFADPNSTEVPAVSKMMRHAVGGLQETMAEAMAIFAPNANSYRRLQPASFVPLSPEWGYNHRGVALRIPVCDNSNMRIEHRVAGADANPYLVMAAVLAGIHHGISNKCEATEMLAERAELEEQKISLPLRWEAALDRFKNSSILPAYLGAEFCRVFELARRFECDQFHAQISNLDYEWYLGSV